MASAAFVSARQQVRPGMSDARFTIVNKGLLESVPVTLTAIDPKMPILPVDVRGPVLIDKALADQIADAMVQRAQLVSSARQTWEYKDVILPAVVSEWTTVLNREGSAGWELVGGPFADRSSDVHVTFKRPR